MTNTKSDIRSFHRFNAFRVYHRRRPAFAGLSLAAVHALIGAREARFAGFLSIRADLDPTEYLEIPFVRRAWRLLCMLGEDVECTDLFPTRPGTCFCDDPHDDALFPVVPECRCAVTSSHDRAIPISWEMTKAIGMDSATARVNLSVLMTVLVAAGFLDPFEKNGLTPRARTLVRCGSIGEFYKALTIRAFNRVPWIFEDGLPQLISIRIYALFLTYVIMSGNAGSSADDLARSLAALVHELPGVPGVQGGNTLPSTVMDRNDPEYWVPSRAVMASAIESRYLTRMGRMLGIVRSIEDNTANGDGITRFAATPFARRAFCWQI